MNITPLEWETVPEKEKPSGVAEHLTTRARIPGGWLVAVWAIAEYGGGLTFVPDPEHKWGAE